MRPSSPTVREKFLVVAASVFATWLLCWHLISWSPQTSEFWKPRDHWAYIYMATHPFKNYGIAPFNWRVLAPWLIGISNPSGKTSYFQGAYGLLEFWGVVVGGVFSYGIGKRLFGTWRAGVLLWCWFEGMYWATKAPLCTYGYLDGATYGMIALLVYLSISKRDVAFLVALTVGVVFKETALFCWPLAYTLRAHRNQPHFALLKRTFVLGLPALCVLMSLRLALPARNTDTAFLTTIFPAQARQNIDMQQPYSYPIVMKRIVVYRLRQKSRWVVWRWTAGAFGLGALVLSALACCLRPLVLLRWLPLAFLAYLQLLLAYNNERMVIVAFPAVLVLIGISAHHLANRFRVPLLSFSLFPLFLFAWDVVFTLPPSPRAQVLSLPLLLTPLLFIRRQQTTEMTS